MPLANAAGSVTVTVRVATPVLLGVIGDDVRISLTLKFAPGASVIVTGSLKTYVTVFAAALNVADCSVGAVVSVSSTPGRPCGCSLDRHAPAAFQSAAAPCGSRMTIEYPSPSVCGYQMSS